MAGKEIQYPHATTITPTGRAADGGLQEFGLDANGNLLVAGVGAVNASVGTTGATAPASATEIGVIAIGGNLVGASATNPVRTDPTGTTVQPVSGTVAVDDLAATALPVAVSGGAAVQPMADKFGRNVAVLNTPRDLVGTAIVSNNSTASGVSFIGAGAAGVFNDIITFIATNRAATATVVSLTDGTAVYTFALAANGGIVINFPTPLPATSSATAWTIGNSATVACDYVAVYAKNK